MSGQDWTEVKITKTHKQKTAGMSCKLAVHFLFHHSLIPFSCFFELVSQWRRLLVQESGAVLLVRK
jgi:hypothetical protein